VQAVNAYESGRKSQREIADELEIPRTTLQYWIERKEKIDADPDLIDFFESEVGIAFLHRLIVAIHFIITMQGSGSVRTVCNLLELSGLDNFVAGSYSQRGVTVEMEEAIVAYGQAEGRRLGQEMPAKEISVCADETFHPEVCLVAIEPVSNYILLEEYAPDRKAETWTVRMEASLNGLPVEVIQGSSDEARALCYHIENDLGAHQSPDVFHVQHTTSKATMAPLASQIRQADKALEQAQKSVQKEQTAKANYMNSTPRPLGRPPAFDKRMAEAQAEENQKQALLKSALERQSQATTAMRGISESYHPYDLETGAPRDAECVAASLATHFDTLETIATEASLSDRSLKNIHKARRVVTKMVATITFFFLTVQAKVGALTLTPEQEHALHHALIPAIYLELVADKSDTADERHALHQLSQQLLDPLLEPGTPFASMPIHDKQLVESVASECAQLFQRSSSCVEGRNGQLALRHHSLHRISQRKLSALTVVHNFFIQRPDGSTPAQRFFEADHRNLFDFLVDNVDLPGRPAQKRPPPDPVPLLL
jgi:Family of unknown function (DUF6399)